MSKTNRPRFGSLQFWPRKRASKFIPSANWKNLNKRLSSVDEGILGFVSYKVGMASAIVKDETDKSMTKGKRRTIPVTILEVPNFKIFSVRFYKNGVVMRDVVVSNDKELKNKVKVPKELNNDLDKVEGFDDIRLIIYPVMKEMFKKTTDVIEVGIRASDKLGFVKDKIGKEISLGDVLKWSLVDVRGLTKGKGLQGPIRRFGITMKSHKSEKGQRNPGSIGPWHPARVTFRVPMSGQLGMFSRVHYNLNVIGSGNVNDDGKDINKQEGFRHYGKIRGSYLIVAGSVQGPAKRQIFVTPASRATKMQNKKKYELLEVLR